MTQGTDVVVQPNNDVVVFEERSKELLSARDHDRLMEYVAQGRHAISSETLASFFQLYLNGSEPEEIARLNPGFDLRAIHWAYVKYDWPLKKDQFVYELQETVKEKVIQAHLNTTGLLADMLTAANKKHSDKIKKYIQTGNEDDLKGVLSIDSIHGLLKIAEGLQKATGMDRTHKVETKTTNTQNINLTVDGKVTPPGQDVPAGQTTLSAEQSAQILSIIAEGKRKNGN